jgi:hypothetical protein
MVLGEAARTPLVQREYTGILSVAYGGGLGAAGRLSCASPAIATVRRALLLLFSVRARGAISFGRALLKLVRLATMSMLLV